MKDRNVRKINKTGDYSYYITIPREYISDLRWRKGQKVKVEKVGDKVVVADWKK